LYWCSYYSLPIGMRFSTLVVPLLTVFVLLLACAVLLQRLETYFSV